MLKMGFISTWVAIVILSSCSGSQVISFINEDMDLRDYETYRLVTINTEETDFSVEGMVFFTQIEKGIREQMDQRFFQQAKSPDLIVRYEIVTSQRTETSNTSNFYNPYSYYYPARTISRQVSQGVLIIEFRDLKKQKLVWQGSLDIDYRNGDPQELVKAAVGRIFKTYPYIAGSYDQIPELTREK